MLGFWSTKSVLCCGFGALTAGFAPDRMEGEGAAKRQAGNAEHDAAQVRLPTP